jgi:hypothetical protein
MRFLASKAGDGRDRSAAQITAGVEPDMDSFAADLLGATLVDAQDELWAAWNAIERAGNPERALTWLTEPPPWPPASVAKYLGREGESAMSMVETLAAELAPDASSRAWLVRSWLQPGRRVDEQLIHELAHADSGRLGREPRFRAWLEEEWTAWARQRYRRVARVAAADPRPALAGKNGSP